MLSMGQAVKHPRKGMGVVAEMGAYDRRSGDKWFYVLPAATPGMVESLYVVADTMHFGIDVLATWMSASRGKTVDIGWLRQKRPLREVEREAVAPEGLVIFRQGGEVKTARAADLLGGEGREAGAGERQSVAREGGRRH